MMSLSERVASRKELASQKRRYVVAASDVNVKPFHFVNTVLPKPSTPNVLRLGFWGPFYYNYNKELPKLRLNPKP